MCYVAVSRICCKHLQIGDIRPPFFHSLHDKNHKIFSSSFSKTRYVSLLLGMFKIFFCINGPNKLSESDQNQNVSWWNKPYHFKSDLTQSLLNKENIRYRYTYLFETLPSKVIYKIVKVNDDEGIEMNFIQYTFFICSWTNHPYTWAHFTYT